MSVKSGKGRRQQAWGLTLVLKLLKVTKISEQQIGGGWDYCHVKDVNAFWKDGRWFWGSTSVFLFSISGALSPITL